MPTSLDVNMHEAVWCVDKFGQFEISNQGLSPARGEFVFYQGLLILKVREWN